MTYLTKKETVKQFKDLYSKEIKGIFKTDKPLKRMTWNNYVDSLSKDGVIHPERHRNWTHPKFISN